MTDRIVHRGPDADGFLVDAANRVFLGHRRLSILDIAGGVQPMTTVDGALSIVFNGEIYNFHELRAELERLGARFQTDHSDTEVLLHAWRHWREGMFGRLNGMWAFALLDRQRKELILSRDRFGKKPLYYGLQGGQLGLGVAQREHQARFGCQLQQTVQQPAPDLAGGAGDQHRGRGRGHAGREGRFDRHGMHA